MNKLIISESFIKEHNLKCCKCKISAYATHIDREWNESDYCEKHYNEIIEGDKPNEL